jgi:hypothetical protein
VESPLIDGRFRLLGVDIEVVGKTLLRDASGKTVEQLDLQPGQWVTARLRSKGDGLLRARELQLLPHPRKRFALVGVVTGVGPDGDWVEVGTVRLVPAAGRSVSDVTKFGAPAAEPELWQDEDPVLGLFQRDEQKSIPLSIRLGEHLRFGGQLTLEGNHVDNRSLERGDRRDKEELGATIKLDLLWHFAARSFALLEGRAGVISDRRNWNHDETEAVYGVSRAYASVALSDRWRLVVGRQDFMEEREWLYDEVLDGVRLFYTGDGLEAEASASFGRELLDQSDATEGIFNAAGLVHWRFDPDHRVTAYALHRRDTESGRGPRVTHYGLRSSGRPGRGLRHWLELARAEGREGEVRIEGTAVDAGLGWVFDAAWVPSVTLGFAFASGRDRDAQAGAFRQTGLQDNTDKLGGISSFRYYGELVDPELSNLIVTTAVAGVRPLPRTSVHVAFHTYHQHRASTELRNTNLRTRPDGDARFLGWELDGVLSYRVPQRLDAELVLGMFDPGDAFDRDDAAYLAQLQLRFKF